MIKWKEPRAYFGWLGLFLTAVTLLITQQPCSAAGPKSTEQLEYLRTKSEMLDRQAKEIEEYQRNKPPDLTEVPPRTPEEARRRSQAIEEYEKGLEKLRSKHSSEEWELSRTPSAQESKMKRTTEKRKKSSYSSTLRIGGVCRTSRKALLYDDEAAFQAVWSALATKDKAGVKSVLKALKTTGHKFQMISEGTPVMITGQGLNGAVRIYNPRDKRTFWLHRREVECQ